MTAQLAQAFAADADKHVKHLYLHICDVIQCLNIFTLHNFYLLCIVYSISMYFLNAISPCATNLSSCMLIFEPFQIVNFSVRIAHIIFVSPNPTFYCM